MNILPTSSRQSNENRSMIHRRHTNTTIEDLPDEVLVEIFMSLEHPRPLRSWHKINLVCRRWRHIAVEAPYLWTKITTQNHDLALLMLERSKLCELDVELHDGTPPITRDAILAQIERIGVLRIDQDLKARGETDRTLQSIGKRALRLRKLTISDQPLHSFGNRSPPVHWPTPFISLSLVASKMLQVLDLETVECDWSILPLPNLTWLAVRHPSEWHPGGFSDQIISTLGRMPALRYLSIDCMGLFSDRPDNLHSNLIEAADLPQLAYLALSHARTEEVEFMLRHMVMPRLSGLYLLSNHSSALAANADHSSFLSAISATLSNGDFPILDGLSISDNGFIFSRHDLARRATPVWLDLPSHGFGPGHISQVVAQMAQRISRLTVHSTSMEGPVLLRLFSALPTLEKIALTGRKLLRALIGELITLDDQFPIPFPALTEIKLREAMLDESSVEALRGAMMARVVRGRGIQRLEVVQALPEEKKELECLIGLVAELKVELLRDKS